MYVIYVAIQRRGDGAAHPVVRPVCHAGGNGCLHCSEKGTQIEFPETLVCATLCFLFVPPQWMFLQLNPLWDGPIKQLLADADAWLCKRRTGTPGRRLVNLFAFLFVWSVEMVSPRQICARKSPFWTQKMVRLIVLFSNMSVCSTSSTICHLHASWRGTTSYLLVGTKRIKKTI